MLVLKLTHVSQRGHWCIHMMYLLIFVMVLSLQNNTLRPRQNCRQFSDDIFKCIFLNENMQTYIKLSLKFVPNIPVNNIPALVQIMAWRRPGDKPLSDPMMVRSLTLKCVTLPQWDNHENQLVTKTTAQNETRKSTNYSQDALCSLEWVKMLQRFKHLGLQSTFIDLFECRSTTIFNHLQ